MNEDSNDSNNNNKKALSMSGSFKKKSKMLSGIGKVFRRQPSKSKSKSMNDLSLHNARTHGSTLNVSNNRYSYINMIPSMDSDSRNSSCCEEEDDHTQRSCSEDDKKIEEDGEESNTNITATTKMDISPKKVSLKSVLMSNDWLFLVPSVVGTVVPLVFPQLGVFDVERTARERRGSISIYDEQYDYEKLLMEPKLVTAESIWKSGICSFFSIHGEVVSGEGLVARDFSGTSDPYVKVKLSSKCVHKTKIIYRNLDPEWHESFQVAVDDINTELVFKVYDFDRLSHDDDMGEAKVLLAGLEINREIDLKLPLINKDGFQEDLGEIYVKLSIIPKTPDEKMELSQLLNSKRVKHSSKGQIWDSILSVILVEGKNIKPPLGMYDTFVRFKLGADKYKSKVSKQTANPSWREQFDMKLFMCSSIPQLEVTLWDKDQGKESFLARTKVDLSSLEPEKSHYLELTLDEHPGLVCMYLSITATNTLGGTSDVNSCNDDPDFLAHKEKEFSLVKTFERFKQVGWMQLKIHRAVGLAVADLGGASDPFAIIELGNQRLVTPTVYKTLNPQWEKVYELVIYDIHDILEITIYDEDKHGAPEFLGRIKLPLLSIVSGEKRLYQLKDKRLQTQSKGHLIMTTTIVFNVVRASVRTFNPKQVKALEETPRFRRQLLQENVNRLTNIIQSIIATGEFIQTLFTWEYKLRSAFAFIIYLLLVMNFELFMLPLIFFLVLLKNYVLVMLSPNKLNDEDAPGIDDEDDDDDDDGDKSKKGKSRTFREKWEAINNICTLVQNHMDNIASFGERIKNTFSWTVPFLSYLLMVILLLLTILLYVVPLRYILLVWGVNKFTKRIRKPNAIPNNEVLDFLSRVPSDPECSQRRVLRTDVPLR